MGSHHEKDVNVQHKKVVQQMDNLWDCYTLMCDMLQEESLRHDKYPERRKTWIRHCMLFRSAIYRLEKALDLAPIDHLFSEEDHVPSGYCVVHDVELFHHEPCHVCNDTRTD